MCSLRAYTEKMFFMGWFVWLSHYTFVYFFSIYLVWTRALVPPSISKANACMNYAKYGIHTYILLSLTSVFFSHSIAAVPRYAASCVLAARRVSYILNILQKKKYCLKILYAQTTRDACFVMCVPACLLFIAIFGSDTYVCI